MKKRRSLTKEEQVSTLAQFIQHKRWTQQEFIRFLDSKGILMTAQHLNDVLHKRRAPGPRFCAVFLEITGVRLVRGLIEEEPAQHERGMKWN
jgi:hypothetical protein